mmetsp:Transcript_27483/g.47429  ORF Transcript_27483/g.47429 Transcript_27483/m.47429 type:complete len:185 (+) Transcript_27483:68-622(+)
MKPIETFFISGFFICAFAHFDAEEEAPSPSPSPSPSFELDDFEEESTPTETPAATVCAKFTECASCTQTFPCGWCNETSKCSEGSPSGPSGSGACRTWSWFPFECIAYNCSQYTSCAECSDTFPCAWCNATSSCNIPTAATSCSTWVFISPHCPGGVATSGSRSPGGAVRHARALRRGIDKDVL